MGRRVVLLVATAALTACSSGGDDSAATTAASSAATSAASPAGATTTVSHSIGDRSFDVFVPTAYDGSEAAPLVLLLHGYTSSGAEQEAYFGLQPVADEQGMLFVHPDGTTDGRGDQFWNATDACCNFTGSTVDDSSFLAAVIADVQQTFNVDSKRIYVVGHSNGGFMSYRMACDHAGTIAAIASLAGATFADTTMCDPSEPVSVLQIHGSADSVIAYDGGGIGSNAYPGAPATVGTWATYNGCGPTLEPTAAQLDLEVDLPAAETDVGAYGACPPGGEVELWTIEQGAHTPDLSAEFAPSVIDFLLAHPKP